MAGYKYSLLPDVWPSTGGRIVGKTKSRVKKKKRRMIAARQRNEEWCRKQPHREPLKVTHPKWGFIIPDEILGK